MPDLQGLRIGATGFEPATFRPPAGCATRLRHAPWPGHATAGPSRSRAGDGNRTRPRSLEGFCATTTLRPRAGLMIPVGSQGRGRRSSVGTVPSSSVSDGGGQGPNQLSRAPSRVITEPDSARPSGEHGERDEPGVLGLAAEALQRHGARGRAPDRLGVLAQRLGVEVAGGERDDRDAVRAPTRAPTRACSPRRRPARRSSASCPARPWCGDSVTLTIVPPPAGRNARATATRDISSVPPTLSRCTARQPLGSIASAGTKYWPPALLTSASSRPQRSSAKSTRRSASSALAHVARHPRGADLRRRRRQHLRAPPADHHRGAAAHELGRGGAAEPGTAARSPARRGPRASPAAKTSDDRHRRAAV